MSEHIQIGDVSPRIQYVADGGATAFIYPFPIFEAADLLVHLDDVLQTSGYTVSGAGETAGGLATLAAAPPDGTVVTLTRRVPEERTTDFQEGGAFRAVVINTELDRVVCMVQQLRDDLSRSVLRPATSTSAASLALPDPAAGRALKWNAAGDGLSNSDGDPDAAQTACAASVAAAAGHASAAQTAQAATEAALANTLAAFDSFDDRYLGAKTADPVTDNDGDPLVGGALYFNSTTGAMRLYTGSAWVAAYVSGEGYLDTDNALSELSSAAATARGNIGAAGAADLSEVADDVSDHETRIATLESASGALPSCSLVQSVAQAIPNGASATLTGWSEVADAPGWHDPSTNPERITVADAGVYLLTACSSIDTSNNGQIAIRLLLNGVIVAQFGGYSNGTAYGGSSVTAVLPLAAGDYVTAQAWQYIGTAYNTVAATTRLAVVRLS